MRLLAGEVATTAVAVGTLPGPAVAAEAEAAVAALDCAETPVAENASHKNAGLFEGMDADFVTFNANAPDGLADAIFFFGG